MADLFNGALPLQASPKLAKKLAKHLSKRASGLESIFPAFTPTTVPIWGPAQQNKALKNYLNYLHTMATKAKWRGMLNTLTAIEHIFYCEANITKAQQKEINALNRGEPALSLVGPAREDLTLAIIQARKMLGKTMGYYINNPRKATLAEPLFILLLAGPSTLGFLVHKLNLYKSLGQKYPTFWGPNPRSPRWVMGLGIRERADHWRSLAPLGKTQVEKQFRSPLKRALNSPVTTPPQPLIIKVAKACKIHLTT
jgi:hypothetical protein